MKATRVQVIVEDGELALIRKEARAEGLSMSGWMRKAAIEKLGRKRTGRRLRTRDDLRRFFAECDRREKAREPDWEDHLKTIGTSRRGGESGT